MERLWQMMWSNMKVQYLSPVLLVPPNVSGIALEMADDEEEEEEGMMESTGCSFWKKSGQKEVGTRCC